MKRSQTYKQRKRNQVARQGRNPKQAWKEDPLKYLKKDYGVIKVKAAEALLQRILGCKGTKTPIKYILIYKESQG